MNKNKNEVFFFEEEAYEKLKKYLLYKTNSIKEIFILTDEIAKKYCLPILLKKIDFLEKSNIIFIKHGEKEKNIYTCINIFKKLEKFMATRNSILLNLGGGVITDIGGFISSIFKRGIRFINIPTTLLGMIDASIGCKTGINFNYIKNEIGSFYTPEFLVIDPFFLKTLSNNEILSGIAEMFKYGLILDNSFWKEMKNNYLNIINMSNIKKCNDLISKSIFIKQNIVNKDLKENGIRKILNFGHTIGHALESYYMMNNKKITHGLSIANGMICEAWISKEKIGLSEKEYKEIKSVLSSIYYSVLVKEKKILEIMQHDKKNKRKKIQFSLLKKIGKCSYNYSIPDNVIKKSFTIF